MDDRYKDFTHFPKWIGLIGGFFFAALLFGSSLGLFYATGYDPFKVPDPRNGTALLISMGAGVVGMMLGWWASYADWLVMRNHELIQVAEYWRKQKNEHTTMLQAIREVRAYVPVSTWEWAERQREEAAITPVAEVDIDPDFDPYAISESGPVTRC